MFSPSSEQTSSLTIQLSISPTDLLKSSGNIRYVQWEDPSLLTALAHGIRNLLSHDVSFLHYSHSLSFAKKILSFSVNVVIFRTLHRIVSCRRVKLLSFPIFRCRERRLIPNCSAMYFFFSPDSCIFFSSNSEFINLLASLLILLCESHSLKTVYHLRECLSTFSDKFGCKSCQQPPMVIILMQRRMGK